MKSDIHIKILCTMGCNRGPLQTNAHPQNLGGSLSGQECTLQNRKINCVARITLMEVSVPPLLPPLLPSLLPSLLPPLLPSLITLEENRSLYLLHSQRLLLSPPSQDFCLNLVPPSIKFLGNPLSNHLFHSLSRLLNYQF